MIQPSEPLDIINRRLKEQYGTFSYTDMPMYRVVWSSDQVEKRWTGYTDEGWELVNPEVRELPKYRQWNGDCFILERCLAVPPGSDMVEEWSYEPLWAFKDHNNNPLPPNYKYCEVVIETVLEAAALAVGTKYIPKYKDPYSGLKTAELIELKNQELDLMQRELFGNETATNTALAHGWGASMNHSERNKEELKK